jgi:hypothetical protein
VLVDAGKVLQLRVLRVLREEVVKDGLDDPEVRRLQEGREGRGLRVPLGLLALHHLVLLGLLQLVLVLLPSGCHVRLVDERVVEVPEGWSGVGSGR